MSLLAGLRVLAVEQYGAGPFGTQALADLGAEVVKIENPRDDGDVSRHLGPYFEEGLEKTAESLFYQSVNRNKKSVAIDLAAEEGRAVFRALVPHADAVACNLRGDVPGRLGITYRELGLVKPSIVCCHLTAYGRDGARAAWPGYDYLIQAEAGYFSLNGEPDTPPARFGLSIVDFMTGYCLATAVLAGVLNARATGVGRDIDVSLFDVGVANLNYLATWVLNRGFKPDRVPRSAHPTLVPCQSFPTADGWIYIMANKEKFWPALCTRLGAPELADEPRFRTFKERLANRPEVTAALDPLFKRRTTQAWLEILAGAVPCAPILSVEAALASPFVAERGLIREAESDTGTAIRVVGSPFRTGDEVRHRTAPALGRHTDSLLAEAGIPPAEVATLKERGVIA